MHCQRLVQECRPRYGSAVLELGLVLELRQRCQRLARHRQEWSQMHCQRLVRECRPRCGRQVRELVLVQKLCQRCQRLALDFQGMLSRLGLAVLHSQVQEHRQRCQRLALWRAAAANCQQVVSVAKAP